MKKSIIIMIVVAFVLLVFGMGAIGTLNKEARLKNLVVAKQKDNTSEFDNMWKVIQQTAQVPEQKKEALKEIFNSYASARTGTGDGGSLMNWIKEAVPNVDVKVYDNLMNIIVSKRDAWTMRQKELIDIDREHNVMFDVFPSNIVLGIFGRQKTVITIVTSSRTEKAFETGKDDDVELFKKK
jgi:hypothetical protein